MNIEQGTPIYELRRWLVHCFNFSVHHSVFLVQTSLKKSPPSLKVMAGEVVRLGKDKP
jgi:hypothetical protein